MSQPTQKPIPPELLAILPERLRVFLARGETRVEADEEDWDVVVERPATYLARCLPPGAVLIAANGIGDHLFLVPDPADPARLGAKVSVYWHEGPEIAVVAEDIASLVDHVPEPTRRPPVFYHDGQTEVRLGDEVTARSFFIRRPGRVIYVPGISKRNLEMEHGGLCWVAITFDNGTLSGRLVNPETSRLGKGIRFVKRSAEPFKEFGLRERFE